MACTSILLEDISKRYQHKWIFKSINFAFEQNDHVAITGPNGSGKSTFLKILSGFLSPSKGKVAFYHETQEIDRGEIFKRITYAAPYISLLPRLSLLENIEFYRKFKPLQNDLSNEALVDRMNLKSSKNKELRFFSSGMLQRVKLALAICANSSILILDEPTTNLDVEGGAWYQTLIEDYGKDRIIIVASNVSADFEFCKRQLSITDYKRGGKN